MSQKPQQQQQPSQSLDASRRHHKKGSKKHNKKHMKSDATNGVMYKEQVKTLNGADSSTEESSTQSSYSEDAPRMTQMAAYNGGGGGGRQASTTDYSSQSEDSETATEYFASETIATSNVDAAKEPELSQQQLAQEAEVKWDTAEFVALVRIPVSDLIREGKNGKVLKEDGSILFSLQNGRLRLGTCTNSYDFDLTAEEKELAEQQSTDLNRKHGKTGRHRRHKKRSYRQDIIKSIELKDVKFNFENQFLITTNVPRFENELYYGKSQNVNRIVMPGQLGIKEPIVLIDRFIPVSVIRFQNRYPGLTVDAFKKDIQKMRDGLCVVSLNNPMISMINLDEKAENQYAQKLTTGKYTPADIATPTGQVFVPKHLVDEYRPRTLDSMKNSISYGDVRNFELEFSVPIPLHAQQLHDTWEKSNFQEGRPFMAFADMAYRNNMPLSKIYGNEDRKDLNHNQQQDDYVVSFRCIVAYRSITKEKIVLLNKLV